MSFSLSEDVEQIHVVLMHTLPANRMHALYSLASLVAQVRRVMFYDLQTSGACYGNQGHLVRRPQDVNCTDVSLVCGRPFLLGNLEAPVAALVSPLMRDFAVEVSG